MMSFVKFSMTFFSYHGNNVIESLDIFETRRQPTLSNLKQQGML